MPSLPKLPDATSKEALWTAYWSPRVEQLMKEWESAVRELEHAGFAIGMAIAAEKKGQQSGIDRLALKRGLPELKSKVTDADSRIRQQIRLELLGKHDGHAEEAATANTPSSPK